MDGASSDLELLPPDRGQDRVIPLMVAAGVVACVAYLCYVSPRVGGPMAVVAAFAGWRWRRSGDRPWQRFDPSTLRSDPPQVRYRAGARKVLVGGCVLVLVLPMLAVFAGAVAIATARAYGLLEQQQQTVAWGVGLCVAFAILAGGLARAREELLLWDGLLGRRRGRRMQHWPLDDVVAVRRVLPDSVRSLHQITIWDERGRSLTVRPSDDPSAMAPLEHALGEHLGDRLAQQMAERLRAGRTVALPQPLRAAGCSMLFGPLLILIGGTNLVRLLYAAATGQLVWQAAAFLVLLPLLIDLAFLVIGIRLIKRLWTMRAGGLSLTSRGIGTLVGLGGGLDWADVEDVVVRDHAYVVLGRGAELSLDRTATNAGALPRLVELMRTE